MVAKAQTRGSVWQREMFGCPSLSDKAMSLEILHYFALVLNRPVGRRPHSMFVMLRIICHGILQPLHLPIQPIQSIVYTPRLAAASGCPSDPSAIYCDPSKSFQQLGG